MVNHSRQILHLKKTILPKMRCAASICPSMSFRKDVWILAVRTGKSSGEYITTEVGTSCLEVPVLECSSPFAEDACRT